METRGLYDPKGELFALLEGDVLYTLEGEATGRLTEGYIVDMVGKRMWRVVGDGVYSLGGDQTVGFLGSPSPTVR